MKSAVLEHSHFMQEQVHQSGLSSLIWITFVASTTPPNALLALCTYIKMRPHYGVSVYINVNTHIIGCAAAVVALLPEEPLNEVQTHFISKVQ